MKDLRKEAEAFTREFWETYCARGPNVLEDLDELIATDFLGHGTEKHEAWYSKSNAMDQLRKEMEMIPDPASVSFRKIDSIQHDRTVIVMLDMNLMVSVGQKVLELDNISCFMTLVEQENQFKVLHLSTTLFGDELTDRTRLFPGMQEPKHYEEVSILFADFQKFTNMVGTIPAKKLVSELNEIFSEFDDIIKRNGIYKVKTIGDAYMAVGGLMEGQQDHASETVQAGIDMIRFINERNLVSALKYDLRVGIHSGPVVGGTLGTHSTAFDVFGDSVNIASRVEQASEAGRLCVSAYTYDLIKDSFECEYRGKVEAKGKGPMDMYWVGTV